MKAGGLWPRALSASPLNMAFEHCVADSLAVGFL